MSFATKVKTIKLMSVFYDSKIFHLFTVICLMQHGFCTHTANMRENRNKEGKGRHFTLNFQLWWMELFVNKEKMIPAKSGVESNCKRTKLVSSVSEWRLAISYCDWWQKRSYQLTTWPGMITHWGGKVGIRCETFCFVSIASTLRSVAAACEKSRLLLTQAVPY